MSSRKVKIAISTCPNDTFAFHGLLERKVDLRGLEFEFELLDIQQLNDRLFRGDFDVAKASFHAALLLSSETVVLPSGSALGFGVGPLLLAANPESTPMSSKSQTALCPGQHTTANLLFQMFYPNTTKIENVVFSEIMPRLQNKTADFGVCIHEGRFTYQQEGLFLVEDLGTRWEIETSTPLPLGGILARRRLGTATIASIQQVIRESIQYGLDNRAETVATMKRYAQEFSEEILFQHVDLYVNEWTVDLGDAGKQSLDAFSNHASQSGIVGTGTLEIFCNSNQE